MVSTHIFSDSPAYSPGYPGFRFIRSYLFQVPVIYFAHLPNTDTRFPYRRVSLDNSSSHSTSTPFSISNSSLDLPLDRSNQGLPTLTLTSIGYGSVGLVYRAFEGCIIKLSASPEVIPELIQEARIYQILQSSRAAHYIPRFIGLFSRSSSVALILSDEGECARSLENLSLNER